MFDKCFVGICPEQSVHINTSGIESKLSQIEKNQKEELHNRDRVDISLERYSELLEYEKELIFLKSLFQSCECGDFPYNSKLIQKSISLVKFEPVEFWDTSVHFRLDFEVEREQGIGG